MLPLKNRLLVIAEKKMVSNDPSHDFLHAKRVLMLAENICKKEGGDMEIILPAALFHDAVIYPKNDPRSKLAPEESAKFIAGELRDIGGYPKEKIEKVVTIIKECSFSKGTIPSSLESKILQDADRLEVTGAISIMRTFASTGQMSRAFYHYEDPFAKKRTPDSFTYGLDLFYTRLLKVGKMMNTKTAKNMAKRRTKFLKDFLTELKLELSGK